MKFRCVLPFDSWMELAKQFWSNDDVDDDDGGDDREQEMLKMNRLMGEDGWGWGSKWAEEGGGGGGWGGGVIEKAAIVAGVDSRVWINLMGSLPIEFSWVRDNGWRWDQNWIHIWRRYICGIDWRKWRGNSLWIDIILILQKFRCGQINSNSFITCWTSVRLEWNQNNRIDSTFEL